MQILFLLFTLFCAVSCQTQQHDVPGQNGRVYFSWPRPDTKQKIPLLLHLHGVTGDYVEGAVLAAGAKKNGFMLVAGRGQPPPFNYGSSSRGFGWNAGYCCKAGGDDIAYVNAVIKDSIEKFNVDSSRVYLSGFSNGGLMTEYMMCNSPTGFKGFLSFAGMLAAPRNCKSATFNYFSAHGKTDTVVPGSAVPNVAAWNDDFNAWRKSLGCQNNTSSRSLEGFEVSQSTCHNKTDATMILLPNVGHWVPESEANYAWNWIAKIEGGAAPSTKKPEPTHAPTPSPEIETGDRPGGDLPGMPFRMIDVQECIKLCKYIKECKSWAFESCGTRCWLKGEVPALVPGIDCRQSGIVTRL